MLYGSAWVDVGTRCGSIKGKPSMNSQVVMELKPREVIGTIADCMDSGHG